MRLELAEFPVKNIRLSKRTSYNNGVLEIDKGELVALVLEDSRITSADLDVAFPGEQTRIVNAGDVVEPRLKVSGPGCVFPGILGPVKTVGEGRTHRLSGVTVMPSVHYSPMIFSGTEAPRPAILDMWGPAVQITPFASTINIVLILKLSDTVSEWEAHATVQLAEFKVANRLAETVRDKTPENEEVFELVDVASSLPRVVYILSAATSSQATHSGLAYYGVPIRESMPTLMHPNELLDGALTPDAIRSDGGTVTTWALMNQSIVLGLLREHGKRLNFLGVILQRTMFEAELAQQVSSESTAKMAQLLGADSAIITRQTLGGGAFIQNMLTVQACVRKGVKTVFITPERGGIEGTDPPLIFYVPEATAMVSTGTVDRQIELPAPAKVIGADKGQLVQLFPGDPPLDPWSEFETQQGWRNIVGGIDYLGGMNLTCKTY